jgi:adenylate cyclase
MKLSHRLAMRLPHFRSIQTRIVMAVSLLVVMIVTAMVWLWASTEQEFYRTQKIQQAESFALAFGQGLQFELHEKNWANMRLKMNILVKSNDDFIYALASDHQENDQIAAASPPELSGQLMTDLVPLWVSQQAFGLDATRPTSPKARISETYLLRDVEFPPGTIRGRKGERIIEAAIDIPQSTEPDVINGTFRVGLTLRHLDAQIWNAVQKTLIAGAIALAVSIIAAYFLAWRLSQPILSLRQSAARIAAGDLSYRVPIERRDELGALARSFNDMSDSLQVSFGRLQQTAESFERFVPEKFLRVIAPRGIENIAVGEYAKRSMTILFSDIRGYTSLSESQTPEETFKFLNEYIAHVGAAIDHEGGFIDKYIGDAVMALFDETHTDSALRAAIGMQQALHQFNQIREQQALQPVETGIGLHRGEVVMGTVGFTSRMDSTVIGDAVNVSSRVEGLTKTYHCQILVTDAVIAALAHPENFQLTLVDEFAKVKGKETAVALYRLDLPGA